jgi:hypothetical protein
MKIVRFTIGPIFRERGGAPHAHPGPDPNSTFFSLK